MYIKAHQEHCIPFKNNKSHKTSAKIETEVKVRYCCICGLKSSLYRCILRKDVKRLCEVMFLRSEGSELQRWGTEQLKVQVPMVVRQVRGTEK